jgi:hypothetical protein
MSDLFCPVCSEQMTVDEQTCVCTCAHCGTVLSKDPEPKAKPAPTCVIIVRNPDGRAVVEVYL